MESPTYVCACPACGAVQAVPVGRAGQSVACPVCCRSFVAPPAPAATPPVPPGVAPYGAYPSAPQVPQPQPQHATYPPAHQTAHPAPYAMPLPNRGGAPLAIPLGGPRAQMAGPHPAAQAYPASYAYPAATGPAAPPSSSNSPVSAEEADESDGPRKDSSTRGLGLEIVVFGLFVVLFALGVVVVVVVASGKRPWKGAPPKEAIPEVVIDLPTRDDAKPRWSDASQFSLRLHAVKVRLKQAAYGPVRIRDEGRRVVVDESQSYLILYVNLQNQRAEPLKYKSWYAMPHRLAGQYRPVELTDSNGTFYPIKLFKDANGVQGHIPQATLGLHEEVNDAIVFTVPPTVNRAEVEWLHISLPAAAFGEQGSYHFEIPVSMIDGWHGIGRSGSLTPE